MKTTVNERFRSILEDSGLSDSEFCRKIGTSSQNLSHWKANNRPIPAKYLVKIIEIFDDLDARWLITGEKYEESDNDNQNKIQELTLENNKLKEELYNCNNKIIDMKDEIIKIQNEYITSLKNKT